MNQILLKTSWKFYNSILVVYIIYLQNNVQYSIQYVLYNGIFQKVYKYTDIIICFCTFFFYRSFSGLCLFVCPCMFDLATSNRCVMAERTLLSVIQHSYRNCNLTDNTDLSVLSKPLITPAWICSLCVWCCTRFLRF